MYFEVNSIGKMLFDTCNDNDGPIFDIWVPKEHYLTKDEIDAYEKKCCSKIGIVNAEMIKICNSIHNEYYMVKRLL